jgi:4-alpha-glucanotransferase
MEFPRRCGILLHPTSLPGDYGIGDLGPAAFRWIDYLAEARQTYWQILPLGPTGYGDSPYQSFSAFAGNTLLISPERLAEAGLLGKETIGSAPEFSADRVDYGKVYEWKRLILPLAFARFNETADRDLRSRFETFSRENAWWLDDYAAFRAIKLEQAQKPWYEWDAPLRDRETSALAAAGERLHEQIEAEKVYQFFFYTQWNDLKTYANEKGIRIIGDIPIFVALDSADVWCNRSRFKLRPDGRPRVVSGVPPDYFSKTGQLWGNPIYDWDAMKADGFSWWIARVAFTLRTVDIVRIDHFRGFVAAWEVPGDDKTAENGRWVEVPGRELFSALRRALQNLPIIAEDLGVITPEVDQLRDEFGFPGMRILQYAFGGDASSRDLPHNYIRNCVAYTGTHDNDTVIGWWNTVRPATNAVPTAAAGREYDYCRKYLNTAGREIHWDFIRAVWASVANTAIVPLQDVLGLGSEARMNLPATSSGNWAWRFRGDQLSPSLIRRLADLTEIYGRRRPT